MSSAFCQSKNSSEVNVCHKEVFVYGESGIIIEELDGGFLFDVPDDGYCLV